MPPPLSGPSPEGRALPTITVMLTTVMAVMDMTIVNVTLPDMMGALGANADQITWVLTAYIVAEAVTIPLTGWLAGHFGRRRVMLFGVGGFVIASALCGLSESLAQMVAFRLLQGVAGAPLIPLSPGRSGESVPGLAARQGDGHLGHGRHARADPRAHRRRAGHRPYDLALGLLYQPAGRAAEPGPDRPLHP
jgi:MFS family permease